MSPLTARAWLKGPPRVPRSVTAGAVAAADASGPSGPRAITASRAKTPASIPAGCRPHRPAVGRPSCRGSRRREDREKSIAVAPNFPPAIRQDFDADDQLIRMRPVFRDAYSPRRTTGQPVTVTG